MTIIQSSIIAIAISMCLFFIVFARQFFPRLSLKYFVIYLLIEICTLLFQWLLVHPDSAYKALWLALLMATSFLMAPCLWLFAKETSLNERINLRAISSWEAILIVVGILLTLPLMLAAHEGTLLVDPKHPATGPGNSLIHETMLLCIALFLIQVPVYLHRCFNILKKHTQFSKTLFSNIDDMPLNTLQILMWIIAGNWLLNLLHTLRALTRFNSAHLDLIFTVVESGITILALITILRRNHTFNAEDQAQINEAYTQEKSESEKKYKKSSLDSGTRARIQSKIRAALNENKIFLENELTLRDFSTHLNENVHHVSQVINQDFGKSFYDLINEKRIEKAKQLLKTEKQTSIIDIAFQAGFNSKSTFNHVFKRGVGLTPGKYRERE